MGTFYDLALLCILLGFIIAGFRRGIVRSAIELAGFVASLIFSVRLSVRFLAAAEPYLLKFLPSFKVGEPLNRIIASAVLFAVMELLVHAIAASADHVFRLPVLRQVNMLLGGAFGLIKGVAVLFVICALTRLAIPSGRSVPSIWKEIGNSKVLQYTEQKNPVETLLQADIWSGVDRDAGQKQKL